MTVMVVRVCEGREGGEKGKRGTEKGRGVFVYDSKSESRCAALSICFARGKPRAQLISGVGAPQRRPRNCGDGVNRARVMC